VYNTSKNGLAIYLLICSKTEFQYTDALHMEILLWLSTLLSSSEYNYSGFVV
jgi:hypothetical protein